MQIVCDTRGLEVSVRNQCFHFETATTSRMVHPNKVTSILVTAPCRISSPAMELATLHQIPFIICDHCGLPVVRTYSAQFINITSLRRKHYKFTSVPEAASWAMETILRKIEGQISTMMYVADRKPILKDQADKAKTEISTLTQKISHNFDQTKPDWKKTVLFLESYAASRYWQIIGQKLPAPFTFSNRVKFDAPDLFNPGINYLYGMLRNQMDTVISSTGLDPGLGIVHCDQYKTPTLVFDLMEPFRPVIDRMLLTAILEKNVKVLLSGVQEDGNLSKIQRKWLIEFFITGLENRISYNGRVLSIKSHMFRDVQQLTTLIKAL
ncbi:MAG: CRISPR-associated endonuclease Cas1 [Bacteroidetes bacterium]|nr:CRISPR-associated endonuclease Cas1 [Bacteroidota bacterium]